MTQQQQSSSRSNRWFIFILIIIVLVVIWLLITRRFNGTAVATEPTPVFTSNVLSPAPPQRVASENSLVFQDNFDHSVGDWELSPISQAEYVNGVMFLEDSNINGAAWARPHLRFQDIILDVDSRWLGGSVGGAYGVQFRLTDSGEFLGLFLHNDGWFSIIQNGNDADATLYESYSSAISPAGQPNHIHIEASGNHFRFFVNGGYLVDLQLEEAPKAGDIMFVAQKVEGIDSFRVGFDNLFIALHPGGEPAQ